MSAHDTNKSCIIISNNLDEEIEKLQSQFSHNRVVVFLREKFLIEDAKEVIKEAYISEAKTKYIILASSEFNTVSQNSLLKILEEPPRNIEFILISTRKSNFLPTVRSRLPLIKSNAKHISSSVELNLSKIDYAQIFQFLKEHARVSKNEAKILVEGLYTRATEIDKLILNESQLDNFDKAYRLLDLNSRPQSVLAMIIMSFVCEK